MYAIAKIDTNTKDLVGVYKQYKSLDAAKNNAAKLNDKIMYQVLCVGFIVYDINAGKVIN